MGLLPALRGVIDRRILVDFRLNHCVGGRTVGRQSRADFEISEGDDLRSDSIFDGAPAASAYHRCGAVGYCPAPDGAELAGVGLDTDEWRQQPSKPLVAG